MKKIIAIVIVISIFLHSCSQLLILANYLANKDYISKNLCENRNKPQLHCNGKCCLKKKLDADSKQKSTNSQTQKEQEVQTLFCNDLKISIPTNYYTNVQMEFNIYKFILKTSYLVSVFHPPSV